MVFFANYRIDKVSRCLGAKMDIAERCGVTQVTAKSSVVKPPIIPQVNHLLFSPFQRQLKRQVLWDEFASRPRTCPTKFRMVEGSGAPYHACVVFRRWEINPKPSTQCKYYYYYYYVSLSLWSLTAMKLANAIQSCEGLLACRIFLLPGPTGALHL